MITPQLQAFGVTEEKIQHSLARAAEETPLGYVGVPLSDLLIEYAEKDPRVCYVGVDTMETKFKERFPDRAFDVGIAEQNEMTLATGLARAGAIPVIQAWSPFTPIRNFDQLRTSLARHESNAKIITSTLGLVNCSHGATHHDMESLALFRVIPNLRILASIDVPQFIEAFHLAMKHVGPVVIMGPPDNYAPGVEVLQKPERPFQKPLEWGKGEVLREGSDATIFTFGSSIHTAVRASKFLAEEGLRIGIVSMTSLKPLDENLIIEKAQSVPALVTLEEQSIHGGLGSAVAEVLAENSLAVKFRRFAIPDVFVENVGDWTETRASVGLSAPQIAGRIREILK